MKKTLYISFLILLMISLAKNVKADENIFYTNLYNIEMTEQEYNNLLELGFNENEIYHMTNDIFMDNKDIEATLECETIEYYKVTTVTQNGNTTSTSEIITKDEYETGSPGPQTRASYDGVITTDYKIMRTNISQLSSVQYRYKVTLTWRNMPSKRSYDIIAIGFEPAKVRMYSDIFFQQQYTTSGGSSSTSVTCIPLTGSNGGSAVFKLPVGTMSSLSSYLYYNVRKASDSVTVTSMDAGGDYAHATENVSEANAQRHSVNHGTGIELESAVEDSFDDIGVATASWYGTW